jgi:hypothetical protein
MLPCGAAMLLVAALSTVSARSDVRAISVMVTGKQGKDNAAGSRAIHYGIGWRHSIQCVATGSRITGSNALTEDDLHSYRELLAQSDDLDDRDGIPSLTGIQSLLPASR